MWHRHHTIFYFFKNRELNELYLTISIKSLALSMIGIFVPIFLWQLGYSIFTILLFFAVLAGTHSLGALPAAKLASRYGFKHSILFSRVILIIGLLFLITLEQYQWSLFIPAILFGSSASLFWVSYHVDFSLFSDSKKRVQEVSIAKIVSSLVTVIGPLIGGLILFFFNYTVLFVIVSSILVIGVIPLFFSKDVHKPIEFSFRGLFKGQKIRDSLSFLGFGFENAASNVIWPLFLFTTILAGQFTSLGLITSAGLFFAFISTYLVGKFSDTRRQLVLKVGSISNAIVWGLRALVRTPLQVFGIDSIGGITRTMMNIPFEAKSYDNANKGDVVKYIVYRETIINFGRVILFVALMFTADLTFGFIGGGSLGSLLQFLF